MAKPIAVIKVDMESDFGNGQKVNLSEICKALENKIGNDYYVFAVPLRVPYNSEPIQFQVFHEKDFTEIKYQELKKIIEQSLQSIKK